MALGSICLKNHPGRPRQGTTIVLDDQLVQSDESRMTVLLDEGRSKLAGVLANQNQKLMRAASWNDRGPPEPNTCITRLVG